MDSESKLYQFIRNMWIMGKKEKYVNEALEKKYITELEKEKILATPKI